MEVQQQQAPERPVPRRFSVSTKDSSDPSINAPPSLSMAHRRMSRVLDPAAMASHLRMDRRMSTFRRLSLAGSQRTDLSQLSSTRPMKLQNTYRIEPQPNEKFNASRVEKVIQSVMDNFLQDEKYEATKCMQLSKSLSDVIKGRVKDMNFPRYKIVCSVVIGQNNSQSMQCASRCLWNTDTDSCASATYENSSIFAIATVYALYFE